MYRLSNSKSNLGFICSLGLLREDKLMGQLTSSDSVKSWKKKSIWPLNEAFPFCSLKNSVFKNLLPKPNSKIKAVSFYHSHY